jgi:hypothetical protein
MSAEGNATQQIPGFGDTPIYGIAKKLVNIVK